MASDEGREGDRPAEPLDSEQSASDSPDVEVPASSSQAIPEDDPRADEQKRFITARIQDGTLVITLKGAEMSLGGPARVLGEFTSAVAQLVEAFNGGQAQLYSLNPTNSVVLVFGDRIVEGEQDHLPVDETGVAASTIAEILDLKGQSLHDRAVHFSHGQVLAYREFTRVVHSDDLEVTWAPRDRATVRFDATRAGIHQESLLTEPELRGREMSLHGVLYRVIESTPGSAGTIGIKLHKWSATPPGYGKGTKVVMSFTSADLHSDIKELLGESVQARVEVLQPVPGQSIDPEQQKKIMVLELRAGPTEDSVLGTPMPAQA